MGPLYSLLSTACYGEKEDAIGRKSFAWWVMCGVGQSAASVSAVTHARPGLARAPAFLWVRRTGPAAGPRMLGRGGGRSREN